MWTVTWPRAKKHLLYAHPDDMPVQIQTSCMRRPAGWEYEVLGKAEEQRPNCPVCVRNWHRWKHRQQERSIVDAFLRGESMLRLSIEHNKTVLEVEGYVRESFKDTESNLR